MYLFWRSLSDKKWAIIGWSLGVISMAMLTILFFPSIRDSGGLDQLSKSVPDGLKGILGDTLSWVQIDHYVAEQVLNLRVPMVVLIFAVMSAIGLSVGEEERRQLKTLQALPLSRMSIFFTKWAVLVVCMIVVSVATFIGILFSIMIIDETISKSHLAEAVGMLALLAVSIMSVTYSFGMATGRKGLTTLLASVFVVGNILIPSMAKSVEALEPYQYFFPYYFYMNPGLITESIEWLHVGVLVAISLVSISVAALIYLKRDIAT
jgi:ABC-2 type transport system permease protein